MKLEEVRAFGKLIDPADYRQGYGFRGRLVSLANRLRVFLERWIVLSILRFEARKAGIEKDEEEKLISSAKTDPTVRPWLYSWDYRPPPAPLHRTRTNQPYANPQERSKGLYGEGRTNATDRPRPITEGTPLAQTVSVAERNVHRSLRYYSGRRHVVFEDRFKPLGATDGTTEEPSRPTTAENAETHQRAAGRAEEARAEG